MKDLSLSKKDYLLLLRKQKTYIEHNDFLYNKQISILKKRLNESERVIFNLNIEHQKFQSFKKGKIWKTLVIYRKLKEKFKNSLGNNKID